MANPQPRTSLQSLRQLARRLRVNRPPPLLRRLPPPDPPASPKRVSRTQMVMPAFIHLHVTSAPPVGEKPNSKPPAKGKPPVVPTASPTAPPPAGQSPATAPPAPPAPRSP